MAFSFPLCFFVFPVVDRVLLKLLIHADQFIYFFFVFRTLIISMLYVGCSTPGQALKSGEHVWLERADKASNQICTRANLAKVKFMDVLSGR